MISVDKILVYRAISCILRCIWTSPWGCRQRGIIYVSSVLSRVNMLIMQILEKPSDWFKSSRPDLKSRTFLKLNQLHIAMRPRWLYLQPTQKMVQKGHRKQICSAIQVYANRRHYRSDVTQTKWLHSKWRCRSYTPCLFLRQLPLNKLRKTLIGSSVLPDNIQFLYFVFLLSIRGALSCNNRLFLFCSYTHTQYSWHHCN